MLLLCVVINKSKKENIKKEWINFYKKVCSELEKKNNEMINTNNVAICSKMNEQKEDLVNYLRERDRLFFHADFIEQM